MKTDEMQNIIQDKMTDEAGTLLEIRNLKVRFTARKKVLTAVDGVSLSIRPGEIVGVVGESGSGKSVTSMSVMVTAMGFTWSPSPGARKLPMESAFKTVCTSVPL